MYAMFAVVYICCRGRAVTNVVRTCSPTPLLKRQLNMFKLANSEVSGGIPPKFELIQAFIVVLVTCKNEKVPIKNKGSKGVTRFTPL